MRIIDLKLATLKLLEPDTTFNESEMSNYENEENYRGYLSGMILSINRAISRMVALNKIPYKTHEIEYLSVDSTSKSIYKSYQLGTLISDYGKIKDVMLNGENTSYKIIGQTLYIPRYNVGTYTIVYSPIPSVIEDDNNIELTERGIPDNLASIIPYYVKADLYHDTEYGSLSTGARNYFEEYLSTIESDEMVNNQSEVTNLYNY